MTKMDSNIVCSYVITWVLKTIHLESPQGCEKWFEYFELQDFQIHWHWVASAMRYSAYKLDHSKNPNLPKYPQHVRLT